MSLVNKDRRFCFKKMSILFILLFSLLTVNTSFSQTNNFIKENRLPSPDEEKEFISKYGRPAKVVNDPVKITVLYDNYLFTEVHELTGDFPA